MPLNVMARPGLLAAKELTKLGVRRLSAGGAISQVVWITPTSSPHFSIFEPCWQSRRFPHPQKRENADDDVTIEALKAQHLTCP
jgi:hypothetical protein